MHRSAGEKRVAYTGRGSNVAAEAKGTDQAGGATLAHHIHIGFLVGTAGAARADKVRRVQGHRGRTHQDAAIPKLLPHNLEGNHPISQSVSAESKGNIAVKGPQKWQAYAAKGSQTREHKHAANTSGSGWTARHSGSSEHLVSDQCDSKPLSLDE
jgi:hypothetical protein